MEASPSPHRHPTPSSAERKRHLLTGRILFQQTDRLRPHLPDYVNTDTSGIVMTGANADRRAAELRAAGYNGTLLIDSAAYMTYVATAEAPFQLPADQLFPDLETHLELQRNQGADFAVTPTGYIRAADSKALKALVPQAAAIERDDVIVLLPVSIAWLRTESLKQLVAVCTRIRQPKAVVLVGQRDPLKHFKEAPANLRRLMADVEEIALLRTDLAAVDALAHGAMFAAIGARSSLRHAVPVGERPQVSAPGGPQYPHVFLPTLLRFNGAQSLANRYANSEPLKCGCNVCQGRGLDRFYGADGETHREAEAHNASAWGSLLPQLASQPTGSERMQWWRERCESAVNQHALENLRIEQPKAFIVPKPLGAWASLPGGEAAASVGA